MLTHSYKQPRKNYQGRSFKEQDLTNQDFSYADIRGADFTGANLTGAKFNYALAGLTKSQVIRLFIITAILSITAGIAAVVAVDIPTGFLLPKPNEPIPIHVGAIIFIFIEFVNITLLVITVRQSIQKVIGYLFSVIPLTMVIISILGVLGIGEENAREWYALLGKFFSFLGITEAQFVEGTEKLRYFRFSSIVQNLNDHSSIDIITSFIVSVFAIFVLIFTLSLAITLAEIMAEKWLGDIAVAGAGTLAVITTGIITHNLHDYYTDYMFYLWVVVILAISLSLTLILITRCIAKKILEEDKNNLFILRLAIGIGTIGGTCFQSANLTDANFSHGILKSTNFRFADATRTFWRQSKYLKFARVENTILVDIKVRELLITGDGKYKEYIGASLRGANLISADLSNANLKLADLGEATLQAACLNNANLREALAIGTNFTTAQMSGTCLEGWNIDHTTILDNVESKYIYLLEEAKPETDDKERRPRSGYFQPGDFTKLFKEVLDTVDLIFRNGVEFKAFMSSFKKVKVENGGVQIDIKSMENKGDGVVVVKIDVPPETNKEKIHREFMQFYDENVKVLDKKYHQKLAGIEKKVSFYGRKTEDTEYQMLFMNQILKSQNSAETRDREKLVLINFEGGNFRTGFTGIKAEIWSDRHHLPTSFTSNLKANPKIPLLYQDWNKKYQQLKYYYSYSFFPRIKVQPDQATNSSPKDIQEIISQIQELEKKLQVILNEWLSCPSFARIENQLRTKINSSDRVRLIIQSSDILMQRLPWHLWNFFSDYQFAETAIALPDANRVEKLNIPRKKIRILGIFGNDKDIDIEADKKYLSTLSEEAEIIFLVQPNPQNLGQKLWDEKGWDIICFSGHSQSEKDGSTGYFDLGNQTKLKIEELENALTTAISRGLKLAIFNSCDGLGLARQFAQLHIPAVIVMREIVPDVVAQQFFQNFLELFASGQSLYISMRQAREKLKYLESKFPGATWLPIIFQNPAEVPPSWRNLHGIYKPNLGEILTELGLAIERENYLTPPDKIKALQQVKILKEVGEFPTAENQDTIKSSMRKLKSIVMEYPAANFMDEALNKLSIYFLNQKNHE